MLFSINCVSAVQPVEGKTYRILFAGNSFINVGNVPEQMKSLCSMYGVNMEYINISVNGSDLKSKKSQIISNLKTGNFDYVVINEYGGKQLEDMFYYDIHELCQTAEDNGTVPVLYNPAWLNIDGVPDTLFQPTYTEPYIKAAKGNNAVLVNAADAWVYAYIKYPDASMYIPNDYHANTVGSYFTSCVFVSTLFDLHVRDVCGDLIYSLKLSKDNALDYGQAAWEFVNYYKETGTIPTSTVTVPDGANELLSANESSYLSESESGAGSDSAESDETGDVASTDSGEAEKMTSTDEPVNTEAQTNSSGDQPDIKNSASKNSAAVIKIIAGCTLAAAAIITVILIWRRKRADN